MQTTSNVRLLDRFLPAFDLAVTQHHVAPVPPAAAFAALKNLDLLAIESPLLATVWTVRGIGNLLAGKSDERPSVRMNDPASAPPGWQILADGDTEIVYGGIGRTDRGEWREVPVDGFAGFSAPGWARIAVGLWVRPGADGYSCLSAEVRISDGDAAGRRRLSEDWWIFRAVTAHLLRAGLQQAARDAQGSGR